jgi:cystathionine gamma-synthase
VWAIKTTDRFDEWFRSQNDTDRTSVLAALMVLRERGAGLTSPDADKLYHPSLPENQGHEIAARQQKGFGAMLSFELDGDEQTLRRFLSGLSLFTLAESLGGVESLISHAATMTHAGMAPEARAAAGISETLLRISTGIEDCEDLIADLENAFRVAAKG